MKHSTAYELTRQPRKHQVVSLLEAAALTGISADRLEVRAALGQLPGAYRLGGQWLFVRAKLPVAGASAGSSSSRPATYGRRGFTHKQVLPARHARQIGKGEV